jgi:hypothetical protein
MKQEKERAYGLLKGLDCEVCESSLMAERRLEDG